ncbi:MAG: hypothetical protein GX307_01495, partial [Euryarchaeota archaeon]|nr:hypothetical protein [Euryarchaeota archaeon]
MLGRIGVLDGEMGDRRYANSSVDLAHMLDLNIPLFVVDTSARIIFMNSSAEASIGRNA